MTLHDVLEHFGTTLLVIVCLVVAALVLRNVGTLIVPSELWRSLP